jgi:hypothetical protein
MGELTAGSQGTLRVIHPMAGGRIAETLEVWDTLGFLPQIGVVPTAA